MSVCALSQALFPWLVLGLSGEEMEVASHLSHPNRESLTSRTRCGWGHAVTWTPLHEIKQDLSIAFRAEPSKVIPPFGGVIRSIALFFGWDICSSLSSSFGVLTACSADSLTQASLPSLAQGS